ncbi:MAG: ferrous iron transport protein B [Candidatus Anoxymicrobium japonicum]|uniref:Ferrous iron transport protein B n=1 Tax=Candidatus Anoxymicrobium japonicum TaxID=2013648 RepID=A0A2N3G5Z7_9ACTN|nr:MAG: ferrous iron transport protein B [Candidatus Anoxymicrobium japonicum]
MSARKTDFVVALAGNPNTGKTTVFNNLTGGRQHVGNWPGVTVEKKEGISSAGRLEFKVIDLPGTYSLTAYSLEEVIVRDFIAREKPDAVVNVIDASNIERNLYLTTQLLELGVPLIIALNMMDEAAVRGVTIDTGLLSRLLGVPVVPMIGVRNRGTDELKEVIAQTIHSEASLRHVQVLYGRETEEEISRLKAAIENDEALSNKLLGKHSARWLAVKLLEEDERVQEDVERVAGGGAAAIRQLEASRKHLFSIFNEDIETVIVDMRYGFVAGIAREAVKRKREGYATVSDRIDRVLTGRILGFPFFAAFMWLMFFLTFFLGKYPMGWIDTLVLNLGAFVKINFTSPTWLSSLLVDGVIGGVGAVLVFLPQIFIIFICISILEDTGYMARAAFIMDRVMHGFGLHGKSFIPLLMGFGCTVPAVMATRTLESDKDRMITILVNPLMSCAARLPVYALFTAAFFSSNQGSVTFSLYLLGIILAIAMAKLFRKTIFRGESEPFVMELPPYRMPTARGTVIHMWERGSLFLRKAGTVILAGSVVIWLLSYLPWGVKYGSPASVAGMTGRLFEPLVKPLGFDWRAVVALMFGFVAKEIVVSTYGALLGVGPDRAAVSVELHKIFTPLSAYTFMAFTLLYTPCLATVAVIKKETGSWKWAAFAIGYSLILAWVVAFGIYRVGLLLALGK